MQFQDGHAALERIISSNNQDAFDYFKDDHVDKTEKIYLSTLDFMSECLKAEEPNVSYDNVVERSYTDARFPLSHLPAINLPLFDGQYETFEQFRDRFTSLIISNRELTDFARMHFLTLSLRGRALECISALFITAENFPIAWQALTALFENKWHLIQRHFASLLNLPVISRESEHELQKLVDQRHGHRAQTP